MDVCRLLAHCVQELLLVAVLGEGGKLDATAIGGQAADDPRAAKLHPRVEHAHGRWQEFSRKESRRPPPRPSHRQAETASALASRAIRPPRQSARATNRCRPRLPKPAMRCTIFLLDRPFSGIHRSRAAATSDGTFSASGSSLSSLSQKAAGSRRLL